MSRNWREADDPCLVLERKQAETCLGCASLAEQTYLGVRKYVCRRGAQKSSTDIQEMRRCRRYAEANTQQHD